MTKCSMCVTAEGGISVYAVRTHTFHQMWREIVGIRRFAVEMFKIFTCSVFYILTNFQYFLCLTFYQFILENTVTFFFNLSIKIFMKNQEPITVTVQYLPWTVF